MAVIGTLDGTFLVPGISANNRLYTAELIERAVERMQSRLADPDGLPITMLSHHDAGDDSNEIAGRITAVSLDAGTHEATWSGYLIDTAAGRNIAAATDPGPDGRRTLDSVSLRGWWLGPVRTVEVDGRSCTTADDLEIDGIDFTKTPGVSAARLTSATRTAAESAGARSPITESVEVNLMSDRPVVYSTSTPSPAAVPPKPGSPAAEAKAAESEHPLAPVLAAIKEARVAIGGWQGPVDVDLSAWGLSNDDVAAAATQLGAAYTAALRVLDPDNDDDLDLPGGDVEAVTCGACGALCPDAAKFCPACGVALAEDDAEEAAPAADTAKENQMSDQTVDTLAEEAAAAARKLLGLPAVETAAPAVEAAPAEDAPEAPKAEETEAPAAPAETPAEPEAPKAEETEETPAPAAGVVSFTADQFAQLMATLGAKAAPVESAPATATPAVEKAPEPAAEAAPAPAATPTAEAIAAALQSAVESGLEKVRNEMLEAYGPPSRKGLVEAAQRAENPEKPLHSLSPVDLNKAAAQIWDQVLGNPGA
jgi:hypothetical protein